MLHKANQTMSRKSVWILLVMIAAILITRAVCLTHEMGHHPDEHVFYKGASSLKDHVLDPSVPFEEVKEYPEGAYLFHLPFQLAGELVERASGTQQDPQVYGRIASVFYFAAGSLLGAVLIQKHLKGTRAAVALYALVMIFSLLHIEQSRYGTGDSISFFLLMLVLLFSIKTFEEKEKSRFWLFAAAGFCTGALGAVKYPQIYFALCPASCLVLNRYSSQKRRMAAGMGLLAALIAGVFLFSPKALTDPLYFARVCGVEMDAYVHSGNLAEMGGLKNHLASVVLYHTLYADFPFALPILVAAFLWNLKRALQSKDPKRLFWEIGLPIIGTVFALYNLFPRTLFFRTYYPYFCLASVYIAWIVGSVWTNSVSKRKIGVVCLIAAACVLMIARGGLLTCALSDRKAGERVEAMLAQVPAQEWQTTTMAGPGYYTAFDRSKLREPVRQIDIEDRAGQLALEEGEVLISASLSHARAGAYLFPIVNPELEERIASWKEFQKQNEPYLIGRTYPEWYYPVFGYWLKGSTGAEYEFPANEIYFRSAETEKSVK